MQLAEFVRTFELRGPDLMWLLGAGASAASGVPTAGQMIWQFRQLIYCSEQQIPRALVENFADPAVAYVLEDHFTRDPKLPSPNDEDEYSALFELAYPSESDRRRFIDQAVGSAEPSFGHVALGTLMALERVRLVWTTNFDALVEDAATAALGRSSRLTVAQIETARTADSALNEGRWPLLGKLHGDFRSTRLKNTRSELQEQDATMRGALRKAADRFGLIVAGYSGRDNSVMESLQEAADDGGFPNGLFWVHRGPEELPGAVTRIVSTVRSRGHQAELLRVDTFDELMDALLTIQQLPDEHVARLDKVRPSRRRTPARMHERTGGWPLVRLNALPVIEYPTSCRRIACGIGGTKEVRSALAAQAATAIAVRRRDGVIAFGADEVLKEALGPYGIEAFDLAPLDARSNPDSMDLSLLYQAMLTGFSRARPLEVVSWRRRTLIVDEAKAADSCLDRLRRTTKELHGRIRGINVRWAEAIEIRLESRLDQVWLVYEPTIWVERTDKESTRQMAREWSKERRAIRYNKVWNELLHGWEEALTGDSTAAPGDISAFESVDGINARFTIGGNAAYSLRRR